MPLYRVVCDGTDILDYAHKDMVLLAPDLELEVNTAGSLEFVLPPYHKLYDAVNVLTSTIEVYEGDDMIWFGRPVEQTIDFFKQKKIYCEGPLSFLNDTIQWPWEFDSISIHDFFRAIIDTHNSLVTDRNRALNVRNITIDNTTVYRKLNYESSYDAIKNMCLSTNDGYLFFERIDGINYIDWLKEMPFSCNQSIQFGLNMLNYKSNFNGTDFATCIIPLGKIQSDLNLPLTIESANNGYKYIDSDAIDLYGRIYRVINYSDISDPYELKAEGQKYLENTQFNSLTIECSAADLHPMNGEYEQFVLGQMVHCISVPHLVDKFFPLSKMSIRLDSAVKQITLGTIKRKTLTRIYKEETTTESTYDPGYTPSYDPGVMEDPSGDLWEIILPEEDGDPVTAIKMPTRITVVKEPNKTTYNPGEALDFTGIKVRAWNGDKAWNNPPKYANGIIPFEELTFSTKKAPNIKNFTVSIVWKYNGKNYYADLPLTTTDAASKWTCNPNWLKQAAGEYIGSIGGRRFVKKNDGPAIAFYRVNSSPNWYGPCLISTDRNAVLTNQGSGITEHNYGGLHWYYQHGWHFGGPNGMDVVTPQISNLPSNDAEFQFVMQNAGVVIT